MFSPLPCFATLKHRSRTPRNPDSRASSGVMSGNPIVSIESTSDLTFLHAISAAHAYARTYPDSDSTGDLSTANSFAKPFGKTFMLRIYSNAPPRARAPRRRRPVSAYRNLMTSALLERYVITRSSGLLIGLSFCPLDLNRFPVYTACCHIKLVYRQHQAAAELFCSCFLSML